MVEISYEVLHPEKKTVTIHEDVLKALKSDYCKKFKAVKMTGVFPFTEEYMAPFTGEGKLFQATKRCYVPTSTPWKPLNTNIGDISESLV